MIMWNDSTFKNRKKVAIRNDDEAFSPNQP